MKTKYLLFTLCFIAAGLSALAGEAPVTVEKAWVRAVPPGSPATAAYMTITNNTDETLNLTGGSTAIANMVHPMITVKKTVDGKEVSGMELVEKLEIAAGAKAILKPGGDHIMIMEMTSQPSPGSTMELTLQFEPGNHRIELELPVSRTAPVSK